MTTLYPAGIDNFNNPSAVNNLSDAAVLHNTQHTNVNDAVEAIETELGINPRGASASVAARLTTLEGALAAKLDDSQAGAASGLATLDAGSKLVQNLDAVKITSGTIAVARIPDLSGAKILGTGGGGAAIPLDAVPALPASKTTSGTFATARIPNLDGAIITTGTISAARLPSSVTANANSRVVADLAALNAIPAPDRVDGMLVTQLDTERLWIYRADSANFFRADKVQHSVLTVAVSTPLSAAWGNATGLAFDAVAGRTYAVEVTAFVTNASSSTPDIRYGFTWTGAGTMHMGVQAPEIAVTSPNTIGNGQWGASVADATSPLEPAVGGPTSSGVPAGTPTVHRIYATYVCTTSGTVTLRIAQNTSDASFASQLMIGSRLRAERAS